MDPAQYLRRFQDRIARHRFVNWTTSVHTRIDLDLSAADRYLAGLGEQPGVAPITREHLWLCAAARVLRLRPLFNVEYDGLREVRTRDHIHLRVSIKLDGRLAWGVIEDADGLDPAGMAQAHARLRTAAKGPETVAKKMAHHRGRLGRLFDDLVDSTIELAPFLERRLGRAPGAEEGTFSVLNAGAFGAEDLHVVLLRPAVAMLVIMRPKHLLQPSPDGPELVERVPMSVPFTHNLMDTDAAGYFLFHMQELLDDPAEHLSHPPGGQA